MNDTTFNNNTQPFNISYTLIQQVIPSKQITFKTLEEQSVRHYDEFIIAIIKIIDI